jgi:NAD(P)-dependent dehydrogenase (short-subunit alcohol dehydrogenase family)
METGAGVSNPVRHVFVTGIGKGLGHDLFLQLGARGYRVTGLLRNAGDHDRMNALLPANARLILADISQNSVIDLIRETVKEPVHLLINNAGISGRGTRVEKIDPNEVNTVINVHCTGVLRVVQALLPNLLAAEDSTVLNISSRMGSISDQCRGTYKDLPVSYSYRIAKAAQNMLTASLRNELGEKIKFISLHPGRMRTQKAQKDADMEPSESARNIITAWESGKLQVAEGILELPGKILPW